MVADQYPNFSICGIPYHVSGDVRDWRTLAHRSIADLDLSYTPPLGSPWDAVQVAAHAWERAMQHRSTSKLAEPTGTPARTTTP